MHLQRPASLQVRQAHKDTTREEKVLIQMWVLFGFLLECFLDSLLDVWILKRIYLKPKVGKTLRSRFFINSDFDSFPFGINRYREEIQKTEKRKAMPNICTDCVRLESAQHSNQYKTELNRPDQSCGSFPIIPPDDPPVATSIRSI